MCGRYLLRNAPPSDRESFWSSYWRDISNFSPRFNICPSEESPVILRHEGRDRCEMMKWGYKPAWSRYQPVINARAESLFSSKMFRESALERRCLVLADGFYEPKGPQGQRNRPWHLFEYEDGRSFAFAGIWIESGFTIITCEANRLIAPVHDRMPLILLAELWDLWLDSSSPAARLRELLVPPEYPGMVHRAVSDYVKKPGNEGPQCTLDIASG